MSTDEITTVLADDHSIVREGIAALCVSIGLRVIGQCGDGKAAIEMIATLKPDFAIVDAQLPGANGLEVIRALHARHCVSKIIILSISREESLVIGTLRAGAAAYLLKDGPSRHLIDAINFVRDGGIYISPLLREQALEPRSGVAPTPGEVIRGGHPTKRKRSGTQFSRNAKGESQSLRIFLCHSSKDKPTVRKLYRWLQRIGFVPWMDERDILPGEDWDRTIQKAVRESHVVIVCLSAASITKEGYVQKEVRQALDVADEKPGNTIFLIPVRLEECQVPERLRRWQWVDLFGPEGRPSLLRSLFRRCEDIDFRTRG